MIFSSLIGAVHLRLLQAYPVGEANQGKLGYQEVASDMGHPGERACLEVSLLSPLSFRRAGGKHAHPTSGTVTLWQLKVIPCFTAISYALLNDLFVG
jgi:hypothetical protein